MKKVFLEILQKSTGKHLRQSNFIKKETLTQVFSSEFCEISKNRFFTEHPWWVLLDIFTFQWKNILGFSVTIDYFSVSWFIFSNWIEISYSVVSQASIRYYKITCFMFTKSQLFCLLLHLVVVHCQIIYRQKLIQLSTHAFKYYHPEP